MENFSEILDEVEIIYNNNKVTYREKGYIKNNDRRSFMLTIVYGDEPKCIYNTNVFKLKILMNRSGWNPVWLKR